MDLQLPAELERFIAAKVRTGRFSSPVEVLTEAVRLLREREVAEESRVLEGIRRGLDDMKAGRGRPADEVFAEIRRDFELSPDA